MKAISKSGITMFVSTEESSLLEEVGDKCFKQDLNERQQELARLLVSRGLLTRHSHDGKIYFKRDY